MNKPCQKAGVCNDLMQFYEDAKAITFVLSMHAALILFRVLPNKTI